MSESATLQLTLISPSVTPTGETRGGEQPVTSNDFSLALQQSLVCENTSAIDGQMPSPGEMPALLPDTPLVVASPQPGVISANPAANLLETISGDILEWLRQTRIDGMPAPVSPELPAPDVSASEKTSPFLGVWRLQHDGKEVCVDEGTDGAEAINASLTAMPFMLLPLQSMRPQSQLPTPELSTPAVLSDLSTAFSVGAMPSRDDAAQASSDVVPAEFAPSEPHAGSAATAADNELMALFSMASPTVETEVEEPVIFPASGAKIEVNPDAVEEDVLQPTSTSLMTNVATQASASIPDQLLPAEHKSAMGTRLERQPSISRDNVAHGAVEASVESGAVQSDLKPPPISASSLDSPLDEKSVTVSPDVKSQVAVTRDAQMPVAPLGEATPTETPVLERGTDAPRRTRAGGTAVDVATTMAAPGKDEKIADRTLTPATDLLKDDARAMATSTAAAAPSSVIHQTPSENGVSTPLATVTPTMVATHHTAEVTVAERPLAQPPVIEQIVTSARIHLRGGEREMVVRLDPPELGMINLRVSTQANGELVAHIDTPSPVVRELLDARLPELRQSLADAGIQVNRCSVALDMQMRDDRQQHAMQMGQQGNHPNHQGAASPFLSSSEQMTSEVDLPRPVHHRDTGALDFFA